MQGGHRARHEDSGSHAIREHVLHAHQVGVSSRLDLF